ncbi:hypothetical protein DXG01_008098 [Tephrocybe rancida]|nr:hypothetical protein DXG01_008098 [Tephrocybe rancida]
MVHQTERICRELKISASPRSRDDFKQLLQAFERNPSIEKVREVTITSSLDQSTFDREMPWIVTDTALHNFLYSLSQKRVVERFTFTALYDWFRLPRRLNTALMCIFGSPYMQSVSLSYLALPKECFTVLALRAPEVRLSHVEIRSSQRAPLAAGAQFLVNLVVEDMDSDSIMELFDAMALNIAVAHRQGANNRSFPRLVDLTIGPTDKEQLPAYNELVKASALTLQTLRWDYPNSQFPELPLDTDPISLVNHHQLRKIVYMVPDINDRGVYHPDPFVGLIGLLRTITPEANRFAELELKFTCQYFCKIRDSLESYDGWESLASLLLLDRFRFLRKVSIQVLALDIRTQSEAKQGLSSLRIGFSYRKALLTELLQRRFPLLVYNNMCSLDLSVPNLTEK